MKGDTKIIMHLNKLLGNELVAINQYFLHARMFKNWGLTRLNDIEYHESIDEMIKKSDTALYESKTKGRDTYSIYMEKEK